ncbi:glycerophosphodiester phosphodiesterase family protein [Streptomyces sp. NPDC058409]|uniref:glycerophosphodiester phosphodiesterase family protein n=1 Tax=Streptomyces sp. NPDC058409 TaxID=3346484 RepID=UPI00365E5FDC
MTRKRTFGLVTAALLTFSAGALGDTYAQADGGPSAAKGPAALSGTPAERAYRDFKDHGPRAKILTAAHRAQWRKAPENSVPAFLAAFKDGAEIVETDVRSTKDGQLVLMHDETVDRTTNGTGKVSDLTLAQIKELRLKQGLGGAQAAVTDERVPTLAEIMKLAKNRGLVNLDKGWPLREQMYQVLADTGTVRNGLFKSDAPVDQVRDFRRKHPEALYMHLVQDGNIGSIDEFGDEQPLGYEVVFDSAQDAVARKPVIDRLRSTGRVWVNSMWNGLADHYTDEASLIDPTRGWGALVDTFGATVIQTDNVGNLESWLRTGHVPQQPRADIRIQAEDFARGGEGVAYHDADKGNRESVARINEDVDICDLNGAVAVCWIRGGEWIDYAFTVSKSGTYKVGARVSSPYAPAGTYRLSFDGGEPDRAVQVLNTTGHSAFFDQPSGVSQYLEAGSHRLRIHLDESAYQNFNLDYLDLVRG